MNIDNSQTEILVVDDTVDNIKLLSKLLVDEGYQVKGASSAKSALRICQRKAPDLILLDIMMPEMDGYELCGLLKAEPATSHIPIIFLSALDNVQDKVKAFQIGAVDYIQKPFEAMEVLARVRTHTEIVSLQKKLIRQNQTLKLLATTDALTGMSNRRHMLELGNKTRAPFSVILFDIDNFKQINDRYGHNVGDEVLREISELTLLNLSSADFAARWGGEEFLILLPGIELSKAMAVAENIRRAFIVSCQSQNGNEVTASFGVATQQGKQAFLDVVRDADAAMYASKHRGKNQVASYCEASMSM